MNMGTWLSEINDDEIRIIKSNNNNGPQENGDNDDPQGNGGNGNRLWLIIAVALILAASVVGVVRSWIEDCDMEESLPEATAPQKPADKAQPQVMYGGKAFAVARDTVAGDVKLSIITPVNAVPTLEMGNGALSDTTVVLASQAADVRSDNGNIVGAYIINGELLSKGEAKGGFCAIIRGEITIGVTTATPLFEQALSDDGCFFRQYPLVAGGQLVENRPKGNSIRKALADIGGKTSIIVSHDRLTFNEFSQALVDIGVNNAVYLVGGGSYTIYRDEDGNRHILKHDRSYREGKSINYIVWR